MLPVRPEDIPEIAQTILERLGRPRPTAPLRYRIKKLGIA